MPLSAFHPLVARWFGETLGEPTVAQQRGWEAIRQGRHTLIAAPTGSGKTLAAFLTAIDDLVREARVEAFLGEMVYYTPGSHFLTVLAGRWTGSDGLHSVHGVMAFVVALKAGLYQAVVRACFAILLHWLPLLLVAA